MRLFLYGCNGEKRMRYLNISLTYSLVAVVICCFYVAGTAAVSVTTTSDQITKGDTVSIAVQDLKNNSVFSFRITGIFPVSSQGNFSFEANNFQIPFSLKPNEIKASIQNTDTNIFDIMKGDTEVRRIGHSKGGSYSVDEDYNISAGTYDFLKMGGTASPDTNSVTVNLEMTGIKSGPDSGTISFQIGGIDTGTVTVNATVNGSTVLSKTITVTAPVYQTVADQTPVTASAGSGYSSGGGGGDGTVGAVIPANYTTIVSQTPMTTTPAGEQETIPANTSVPASPVPSSVTPLVGSTTAPTSPTKVATDAALPLLSTAIAGILLSKRIRKS
jgi:hypothetical protein